MFKRSKPSESVLFLGEDGEDVVVAPFKGEVSVLDVALDNGVGIPTSCEGMGTCGTCRVLVLEGGPSAGPRTEIEAEMAFDRGFADEERLACQITACNGMRIKILQST